MRGSGGNGPFAGAWRAQVETEFRNRLRSPSSLAALLVILIGSYWAIPPADGRAVSMSWRLEDGRLQAPIYTAGSLGIALAVLVLLFFALAAFYIVAGSVRRDRERGIGSILAATPQSKSSYLGAKWLAHALYLTLLSLLVFPVGLFHFFHSGVGPFDAAQFFGPALLMALPAALFVSAAALFFDVTPGLRGKGGLVLWFLLGAMPMLAIPAALSRDAADSPRFTRAPLFDPLGMAAHVALVQASLPPGARDISSGYVILDQPIERVAWPGLVFPPGLIRQRALNLPWAALPFAAAVLIFDRFDPARVGRRRRQRARVEEPVAAVPAGAPVANTGPARTLASLAPVRPRPGAGLAVMAEIRLLWSSANHAKWLVPLAGLVAAFLPVQASRMASGVFLLLLVPLVSEVACREGLAGTRPLVLSQPAVPRSIVLWKFAAVTLFLLVMSAPLTVRGLLTATLPAVAVPLGMLFFAAFAVGAAFLTGGGKLFSGVILLLWYLALNGLAMVDFCGILAPGGGWSPRLSFPIAGALSITAALLWERRRGAGEVR